MDRVYNFSLAERISTGAKIVEGAPKIDMTGITHENFDSFSGSDSELNDRKKQLFNHIIAPYASLIIGTEVEVIKISDPHHRGLEAADIKIIDVKDRGCLAGDKMVDIYRRKQTVLDYYCCLGCADFDY